MAYRKPISKLELLFAMAANRPYRYQFPDLIPGKWHYGTLEEEQDLESLWSGMTVFSREIIREVDFPEPEEDKDDEN